MWDMSRSQSSTVDLAGRRYKNQRVHGFVYTTNSAFHAADRLGSRCQDLSSPEVLTYAYNALPGQYTVGGGGSNPTARLQQYYFGLNVTLSTSGTPFGAIQAITLEKAAPVRVGWTQQ
jgi:hypothetical protein